MDSVSVTETISGACEKLGVVELAGIRLETGDPRLLDVSEFDLDRHAAMQPAAIAYYGMLKKAASRRLANLKKAYDRWEKKQYAKAKAAVLSGTQAPSSIKVEDVKARFVIDNEPEIEKWEKQLETLQRQYDDVDAWYEAWKQKSFSIREMVDISGDERHNANPSVSLKERGGAPASRRYRAPQMSDDTSKSRVDRVREIMGKKRGQKEGGAIE